MKIVNTLCALMFRYSKYLVAIASLLCTAIASSASETAPVMQPSTCKMPHYPDRAHKLERDGVSVLGFLIRPDGTVSRAIVLSSSGSADLDLAARNALSQCQFKHPASSDHTGDVWTRVSYLWSFEDDPGMGRAKQAAALGARTGKLADLYHLSLLLSMTAKTDIEREQAMVVLRNAAERGHAQAQFDLGDRYEKGKDLKANLDEAIRWYRKSAEQDDPLAIQRMKQLEPSNP